MPSYKVEFNYNVYTFIQGLFFLVDFEYVLVQSCSGAADLVHSLILNSVVMDLIHHLHLSNKLVGKILQFSHPRGIFNFS